MSRSPISGAGVADNQAATLDQARRALAGRQYATAVKACAAAIASWPDCAEAHFIKALALWSINQAAPALDAIETAVALAPDKADYHAQHARLHMTLGKAAKVREIVARAVDTAGSADCWTLDTIGCLYAHLGEHERAVPFFERALTEAPDALEIRFNLASSLTFFGRTEEAARHYKEILARAPHHGQAHLGLANLTGPGDAAAHLHRLEAALSKGTPPLEGLRMQYAAAKMCEDLELTDRAFIHLRNANSKHRARLGDQIAAAEQAAERMMTCFSDTGYFAVSSDVPDSPIFVTGLPRTGTTLVDSILAAHPQVSSAGELHAMASAVDAAAGRSSGFVLSADTIASVRNLSPKTLGQEYIARARQHHGAEFPIFTDKFPLNFLYIGFIARSLPNAKLVCVRRDAMDTVYGIYRNLFSLRSRYYDWTFDLLDIARMYVLYDRLIAFFKRAFPGRIFELRYEDLVSDQAGTTRRLLSYCGLEWDDACLRFFHRSGAIATPSAMQVRKPVSDASVGRWRRYEAHLAEAHAFLHEKGLA